VPEHGGGRERLCREADEPDHEKPHSKVPHTALIGAATCALEGASHGRPQHGELIGDLEPSRPEAIELRGSSTRRPVGSLAADGFDRSAAEENALEVRRRDLVPERRFVDVAQLGQREVLRGEREADVRVRELAAQAITAREDDLPVIEGRRGQYIHAMPGRIGRDSWIEAERDEPEIRGRELPVVGVPRGVAPRAELLQVRDLADVDLRREVPENRVLERLVGDQRSPWERPCARERRPGTLPEQDTECSVAHLEDGCERDVRGGERWGARLSHEVIDSEAKTTMSVPRDTARDTELALVVVGGGVAGLFAALCAAAEGDVLVLTKGPLLSSTSLLAQGGIAAAIGADDDPFLHAEDTLRTGRGLCRPSAVSVLTDEAPARIRDLVELGVEFDDGLGLEGGHSRRRVVHAGGAATGDRVARKLAERVLAHPRITVAEGERMLSVWRDDDRCVGVVTDRRAVAARATLLSTGGAAALWERTTNPAGAVGEGIEAAYRAGAALADLEFVQFHPTTLVDSSLLLSEALRGEGAVLLDDQGNRFTDELAPRDVVAREIAARGTVLLDLRAIDRGRFPSLMGSLVEEGYDPAQTPIPVAPAAHYTVGGVLTDLNGRSELAGLYAAGECAATGVHGANRLASNSLLECLVFGRRAALSALAEPGLPALLPDVPSTPAPELVTPELRASLWRDCGLIRDAEGLGHLLDAPHLLTRIVAQTALTREESRGSHFRADFPSESEEFERHVVLRPGSGPELETWL
jgi:L-aspartate oxidase